MMINNNISNLWIRYKSTLILASWIRRLIASGGEASSFQALSRVEYPFIAITLSFTVILRIPNMDQID